MAGSKATESVERVSVDVGIAVLDLFPRMTYKTWVALGEYVDNSIQSFYGRHEGDLEDASKPVEALRNLHGDDYKLKVEIFSDSDAQGKPRIIVRDNAAGISSAETGRAFRLGVAPGDLSGLSQYGIGMKSASLWFARKFTLISSAVGEDVERTVVYDRSEIVGEQLHDLPVAVKAKSPNVHGTTLILEELHRGIAAGPTLKAIRAYLGSIYRDFIQEGLIDLRLNDEPVEFSPPALLRAKFWDGSNRPVVKSAERVWRMDFDFALDESWAAKDPSDRPPVAPHVRGWVGILGPGSSSTKTAGLALIWRHKVVAGAGLAADGVEDQYKPNQLFGASTSWETQRLYGHVDVSEFPVSPFKDSVAWTDEDEAEFVRKLREFIRSGDESLRDMINNYRQTESARREGPVKSAVDTSVSGTTRTVQPDTVGDVLKPDGDSSLERENSAPLPGAPASTSVSQFRVPNKADVVVTLEVKEDPEDDDWLRVQRDGKKWGIVLNRSHPFMNSFVSLPGADIDPVMRIAAALGLAEISAISAGLHRPQFMRLKVNDLLRADLATRVEK